MTERIALSQYRKRFDALMGANRVVDTMLALYGGMPEYNASLHSGLPRRDTILALLNRFKAFIEPHFDFFFDGFGSNPTVKLFESTVLPPSAVLGTILLQMTEDLELIQRAAEQRLSAQLRPTLEKADKLAWLAVQQAEAMFPASKPTTVVTYFHKIHQSRVIPYAPVVLVGIPLTCTFEERDFLSIPHEVGHYVYHHRSTDPLQDPVNKSYARPRNRANPVNGIQSDWAHWQEEIFADVFGALIAGPVMAYDFQELMREYERRSFIDLNDQHPMPAIRPLIYTHVLRQNAAFAAVANQLDDDWHEILEDRWRGTYASRGFNVLKQKRGSLEVQTWRTLMGNPANDDFDTLEESMTLERFANMRTLDTVQGTEWDHETENYLAQLYHALRLMHVSGNKIELIPPLRDLVDRAASLMTFASSNWSGSPQTMLAELQSPTGEGDKPFKDGLANLTAGVNVTDLATAAPANLWQDWVRGEKFFGGKLPEELAATAGGSVEIAKGLFEEIVLNRPIPANPSEYSWVPVWHAGGWTTEPPKALPPGG